MTSRLRGKAMQVTLIKPHEHAGRLCHPGEVIELAEDLAQWLCEVGSAKPAANVAKPSKPLNTTQE